MRIVVTGSSGFLAATLLRVLRRSGIEAIGVSRRPSPQSTIVVTDYSQTPDGDVLVHFAQDNDRRRVNEGGEKLVAEAARELHALLAKRYGRVLYISSAAVYGDFDSRPRTVGDPVYAADAYVRMKLASESAVLASSHSIVARVANAYGDGMSGGNVISTILRQLPGAGPMTVHDTAPIRDFVWADDVARALALMVRADPSGIFNIGTGVGTSIGDVARLALRLAGRADETVQGPARGSSCLVLDCSSTCREFGWRPEVDLEQGLAGVMGKSAR